MLSEKVVIITGGAGMIGHEFVKSVADNGGISIIADVDTSEAERLKKISLMNQEVGK